MRIPKMTISMISTTLMMTRTVHPMSMDVDM